MKALFFIIALLISLPALAADHGESAYDRVMRTGTLRCGYALWPGDMDMDPNTKTLSGPFYDVMESLGKAMEIKIVWQEEVSFGDMVEALNSGRIDAHCSGAWTNSVRGKFMDHTTSLYYAPLYAYVRANDGRFDKDLMKINDPHITVSLIDGESAQTIASGDFPLAKTLSMPKGTDGTQMLLNVVTGKADVTFTDPEAFARFDHNNPGRLRKVATAFPVRLFGNTIWMKKGEQSLVNSLNTGIDQLLWTGAVDRILDKYDPAHNLIRAKMPYETDKSEKGKAQ